MDPTRLTESARLFAGLSARVQLRDRRSITIRAAGPSDAGELAVLVEDGWQSLGLGTVLLRHLVTMARLVGFREVYAVGRSTRDLRGPEQLPVPS